MYSKNNYLSQLKAWSLILVVLNQLHRSLGQAVSFLIGFHFSATLSFELPDTIHVSPNVFAIFSNFLFTWEKLEVLLAEYYTNFYFSLFKFDGFQKEAIQMVKPAKEPRLRSYSKRVSWCMLFLFFLILTCLYILAKKLAYIIMRFGCWFCTYQVSL